MKVIHWFLLVFMVLLAGTASPAMGAEAKSAIEPQAMATLQKMGQYLGHAQRFSVSIRDGYDVVQDSGAVYLMLWCSRRSEK